MKKEVFNSVNGIEIERNKTLIIIYNSKQILDSKHRHQMTVLIIFLNEEVMNTRHSHIRFHYRTF